ncbi:MAG: hypothetical protein IKZ19_08655 [Clostridia bacterium]|nr:hypothetical protein [Clostridia bacterium]
MAKFRVKCPHCSKVVNIAEGSDICPECRMQVAIPTEGRIYLYRQGSPYGIAGGFGVFINGIPKGYIGNKETICFPVAYGQYTIHCAVGMSKKCTDLTVNVTPQYPRGCCKVYMKPGFWANSFVIEPLDPKLLGL